MKQILKDVAPCGLFCKTCTGCTYGDISKHSKELIRLLEGHEEFLDKNLTNKYRHKLDEYKVFHKKLKKYAQPKCNGCRTNPNMKCSIKGCLIPDCSKKHNINFCGECSEFPCSKIITKKYKEKTIIKWLENNNYIKKHGIKKYYEKQKNIPHYIDYKGD